jgi:zinc and cadmium transporter
LASCTTVIGGVLAYYSLEDLHDILPFFLALASSSFIYIAVADLIPSLHKKTDIKTSVHQIILILAGVTVICLLHGIAHNIEEEQYELGAHSSQNHDAKNVFQTNGI